MYNRDYNEMPVEHYINDLQPEEHEPLWDDYGNAKYDHHGQNWNRDNFPTGMIGGSQWNQRAGNSMLHTPPMKLDAALRGVLTFDGNPDMLRTFTEGVRRVARIFNTNEEQDLLLLGHIANRLRGQAYEAFGPRIYQYRSTEAFLNALELQYSNVGGVDPTFFELKRISQQPGEAVGKYGLRVQILHNRLLNMYDADRTYSYGVREAMKEIAKETAKENFIEGLNESTRGYVRSRHPVNLGAAIAEAMRHEQTTGSRRAAQQASEPQIQHHHRKANIRATLSSGAGVADGSAEHPPSLRETRMYCMYCKLTNHQYADCRKLARALHGGIVKYNPPPDAQNGGPGQERNRGGRRYYGYRKGRDSHYKNNRPWQYQERADDGPDNRYDGSLNCQTARSNQPEPSSQ